MNYVIFDSYSIILCTISVLTLSEAFQCYQCSGSEEMPAEMASVMSSISSATNATKCNKDNLCTAGNFCLKVACEFISSASLCNSKTAAKILLLLWSISYYKVFSIMKLKNCKHCDSSFFCYFLKSIGTFKIKCYNLWSMLSITKMIVKL